jgi:hypothetical protein
VDILHGLDKVGLPQNEINGFRLIDLDGLDVHGYLLYVVDGCKNDTTKPKTLQMV